MKERSSGEVQTFSLPGSGHLWGREQPTRGRGAAPLGPGPAPSRPHAAHDHVTDFSRAPTGSGKDATHPQSHGYLAEACLSWQGHCPASQRLAFQKPLAISGDGWASTGVRQKKGTYQFLLESLSEFQHPLLHLLYGLRQNPAPTRRRSLNAHVAIRKVQRTTEHPAAALGPHVSVLRPCPVSQEACVVTPAGLGLLPGCSACTCSPCPTKATVTPPLCSTQAAGLP